MAKSKESGPVKPARSQEYVNDSSSESNSPYTSKQSAKRQKSKNLPEASSDAESSAHLDNESESEQSSSSSASDTSTAAKRKPKALSPNLEPNRKKSKISTTPSSRRPNSFKPPPGYESIQSSAADFVSEAAGMFSDLDSKQVWHITVPASVPIASIELLDISAALHGEPILEYKGTSYNMFAASSKGETLLLPGGTDNTYAKTSTGVSRSFHLREVSQNILHSSELNGSKSSAEQDSDVIDVDRHNHQFFAIKEGVKRTPREQPSGLLMRYQPYGAEAALDRPYTLQHPNIAESAVEEDSHENALKVPASYSEDGLNSPLKSSKRRKEGKKSKGDTLSQLNGTSIDSMMDVDADNGSVTTTPSRSKAKKSNPEKKRKKGRKEKV